MLRAILVGVLLAFGGPGYADTPAADLARILRLGDIAQVLRDEGIAYSQDLNRDMMAGEGGAFWEDQVGTIYRPGRIEIAVQTALETGMTPEQIQKAISFYSSPEGQDIVSLETSARLAIADPAIEDYARQVAANLQDTADPSLDPIRRYIELMDLVERNVAGAIEDNMLFYRGMVDGGALNLSVGQIEETVWGDEDMIRNDVKGWVFGYLVMAYQPVSPNHMTSYLTFSADPAGQALNVAMFEGFATAYRQISYELGRALARAIHSTPL